MAAVPSVNVHNVVVLTAVFHVDLLSSYQNVGILNFIAAKDDVVLHLRA